MQGPKLTHRRLVAFAFTLGLVGMLGYALLLGAVGIAIIMDDGGSFWDGFVETWSVQIAWLLLVPAVAFAVLRLRRVQKQLGRLPLKDRFAIYAQDVAVGIFFLILSRALMKLARRCGLPWGWDIFLPLIILGVVSCCALLGIRLVYVFWGKPETRREET